jgi:quinol monooxygenase YgiN
VSTIQSVARFKIHPGKLEEFKRLAAQSTQLAREKDTGTLRYELFFNVGHRDV